MSYTRSVTCTNCSHNFNIESRSRKVRRHFTVIKNSRNQYEAQLNIPTGQTIEEWMKDSSGVTGDIIGSCFLGAIVGIPYTMTAQSLGMPDQPLIISSLSSFILGAGAFYTFIEYMKLTEVKTRQWLGNEYQNANQIVEDVSVGDTVKLEVAETRNESQANDTAYKFIGDLPVDADKFAEWAFQVTVNSKSLAYSHWTGAGKLFSRKQYDDLLSKLSTGGVTRKTEGGWMLTNGGKRSLQIHYGR